MTSQQQLLQEQTQDQAAATTHWLASPTALNEIDCLCLGTGRFLRSVLVPTLVLHGGYKPAMIQPRGRSFLEYMLLSNNNKKKKNACYEIDTVLPDGTIQTTEIPCWGAFSLGRVEDKEALVESLQEMIQGISILGVGVTEAGLLAKDTTMKDLYDLLHLFCILRQDGTWKKKSSNKNANNNNKLVVIDMDNVPNNGDLIATTMKELAAAEENEEFQTRMQDFLTKEVVFVNTMVDRITSQRGSGQQQSDNADNVDYYDSFMVPRCEPLPTKALVVLDPHDDWPIQMDKGSTSPPPPGVVIRSTREEFDWDVALKLRIANGTHTAIAHTLALLGHLNTSVLSDETSTIFIQYLDQLVKEQIIPATAPSHHADEANAVYDDWRRRLMHPHFGLSTFFITQNGAAKGGIRWGPTVVDLIVSSNKNQLVPLLQVSMAFAYAALLRWLTPVLVEGGGENLGRTKNKSTTTATIYRGWLEGGYASNNNSSSKRETTSEGAVTYADGLRYHLEEGWYEFKCPLLLSRDDGSTRPLVESLRACAGKPPAECIPVIRAYLIDPQGGNLQSVDGSSVLDDLVGAVAVLYARMVAGDGVLELLQELHDRTYGIGFDTPCSMLSEGRHHHRPNKSFLEYHPHSIPENSALMNHRLVDLDHVASVVTAEVQGAVVIDLHTHLLPPTHGSLCLWGIDELLTYHYLVAEYFMTAPASMTPENFYTKTKQDQADLIWQALFLDRTPISEATRGVLTTLKTLGLEAELHSRDLSAIRAFYKTTYHRADKEGTSIEEGAMAFCESVFAKTGVEYAIMTNIPFDAEEVQYWRPFRKAYSNRFRSALRVDPLLTGNKAKIEAALRASGYDVTLEGAREYLRGWCDTMQPCYMMASTPHDFVLKEGTLSKDTIKKTGINMDNMKEPFAFVEFAVQNANNNNCNPGSGCDGAEDDTPSVIDENSDFLSQVLMKVCEERDLPVALKIGAHRGVNPRLQAAGDGVVAFADAGMLSRLCTRFPKVRFLATFLSRNNQHEACVLASKFRNLHIYGCWWFCNNPSIIREITAMRVEMLGTAFTAQHSDARVVDQLLYKWPHSRAIIAQVLIEEFRKSIESGWQPTRKEIRRDVNRLFRGSYEEFMSKSLL